MVSKLVLLVVFASLQQSLAKNIFNEFGEKVKDGFSSMAKGMGKEISDMGNPIIQGISGAVGSQCHVLKNMLQVDYNHTKGDRAPNVDDLELVYTTPDIQIKFPLKSAAKELPLVLGAGANIGDLKFTWFFHGFTDNPNKDNFQEINDAFHSIGIKEVLALDASPLIKYCYMCSSTNVHHIGDRLGLVLYELDKLGMNSDNVHLVGHSLGAHICGFTAKRYTELTGKKVARITGLDPAGPCFADLPESCRLKSTDAKFVDVIHSNAGVFGMPTSLGHVDFYPNGGSQQTSCMMETCNHSFSVKLFVYSITHPDAFPSVKCEDYDAFKNGNCSEINHMGQGTNATCQGDYYLQTNGEDDLDKGEDGMTYVNTDGVMRQIGSGFIGLFTNRD